MDSLKEKLRRWIKDNEAPRCEALALVSEYTAYAPEHIYNVGMGYGRGSRRFWRAIEEFFEAYEAMEEGHDSGAN